ncbi:MmcQ/YjbR family DNA-binding protein [Roseivivax sp. GX 12232]|uniref:MmcQ/YjbR family DNA-binding protein n=1 Tax=Roseivivax sp. GX 12232 TaxID=2900547 RepID=UPI001E2E20E9|nr:MmcQ/YjbR family DNA-binding protein [Roseivivax sp. GX 12232]MCE0506714.1 MmcQ/YjbR family DNA-binding protein [Roseivivax sp. GX 12232]
MAVTRQEIDGICAALPGAVLAEPPGQLLSWKVGGKMFACFGDFEDSGGVSVKCPDLDTAEMLIEAGAAERAPYFHRSWVRLPYDRTAPEEARHRLTVSYDTVRAGLSKALRATLPNREDA